MVARNHSILASRTNFDTSTVWNAAATMCHYCALGVIGSVKTMGFTFVLVVVVVSLFIKFFPTASDNVK